MDMGKYVIIHVLSIGKWMRNVELQGRVNIFDQSRYI